MRLLSCVALLALFGCHDEADPHPPLPGGGAGGGAGGGGMGGEVDGGGVQPDAGAAQIIGRLCQVDDLRFLTVCPGTDQLGGIDVREAGQLESAITGPNGGFTLVRTPDNADSIILEVAFESPLFRNTVAEVPVQADGSAGNVALPALPVELWNALVARIGAQDADDTAAMVVQVVDGTTPVAGADLSAPAGTLLLPFFDDPEVEFAQGQLTGPQGTVLLFGVPAGAGSADFSVLTPGGVTVDASAPVTPGGLTFSTVNIGAL